MGHNARIKNNKDIFLSLYRLGSDSVQKFEESRRLRSHVVPLQTIYLRCKLVAIIDEPFRTRAISQLRLILEFRKGTIHLRMFLLGSLPLHMI